MRNTETYNTLQKPEILFPTMKPEGVKKEEKAASAPVQAPVEKIDLGTIWSTLQHRSGSPFLCL